MHPQRDRFVIFLKRKLGDQFHLAGTGWDRAYGLPAAGPLPTVEEYFAHFREAAINLNLVNGNGETGLNMRHFEITAAGGFMLCYQQPELDKCFEVGKECITFRNEQDLLEKIRYYLGRPDDAGGDCACRAEADLVRAPVQPSPGGPSQQPGQCQGPPRSSSLLPPRHMTSSC